MARPPDESGLHEAALAHLARFAATEAGLLRVLRRRIQRWAARAQAEAAEPEAIAAQARAATEAAASVVRRLAETGVVDDAAFAQTRAARLARSGRSRRVIAAHLAARGVDMAIAGDATAPGQIDDLNGAILFARRRRLGPFRIDAVADADTRRRDLGALARAGFPRDVAEQVLAMPADQATKTATRLRSA